MGSRPLSVWIRAVAVWLLGLHLAGLGWTVPLATAAVAGLDDDHQVRLQWSGDSGRVVLSHETCLPGLVPEHVHCPLAGALVALASDAGPGCRDHVLDFGAGATGLLSIPSCSGGNLDFPRLAPPVRMPSVLPLGVVPPSVSVVPEGALEPAPLSVVVVRTTCLRI